MRVASFETPSAVKAKREPRKDCQSVRREGLKAQTHDRAEREQRSEGAIRHDLRIQR